MNTQAAPAPARFALQAPAHYFSDARALALLSAALAGDTTAAKVALAAGASPDTEGPAANPDNRLRLLHYTIAAEKPAAARLLVELGANPELDTPGHGPALLFAITLDATPALGALLDARGFAALAPATQQTLLFRAVTLGRLRSLELLLDRGAPIDLRDTAGYTVLMRALSVRDLALAQRLLARGASVLVQATAGATPANIVQGLLQRTEAGSPIHTELLAFKAALEARGISFPVPTPQALRAAGSKP